MLFWLVVIVTILGLILWILSDINCWDGAFCVVGCLTFVLGVIVTTANLVTLIHAHISAPADIIKHQTEYKALISQQQMELEQYNALSTDCANKIIDWNTNLIRNKVYSEDFWIGVFNPNTYVDVDLIDIDTTSK